MGGMDSETLNTYYMIGETPDGVERGEVIFASTLGDARRAMRHAYPGVDIVETHLLDNEG